MALAPIDSAARPSGTLPVPEDALKAAGISRAEFLRRGAAAGVSVSLMSLLAACGGSSTKSGTGGRSVTEVKWALGGTIASLDNLVLSDLTNRPLWFSLYEGLMRIDDKGKLQVGLAEKWEQPDEKTIVYTLRDGVKFSDGSPLTIEDVVYSYERQLDPNVGSSNGYLLATIKSVKATGPREVTMKLSGPDIASTYAAATAAGQIISKSFAEKHGKKLGTPDALILGSGPYKVDSFTAGQSIVISRNPNYGGPKPSVERHRLTMFSDDQARQVALRSGTVDAALNFPLAQAKQWESVSGVKTTYVPFDGRLQYISFDLTQAPWNDPAVRRAAAFGIDREGIIKSVLAGHGDIPIATAPNSDWQGIAPNGVDEVLADVPRYQYDPERAKAELAKSPTYAKGAKARFIVDKAVSLTAQGVAESLRGIGIQLTIQELPTNDFYSRILPHKDLGLLLVAFGADFPDPDSYVSGLTLSEFAKPNYYNTASYKNATVDRLLHKQKALGAEVANAPEKVNAQRAQLMAAASKIVMTDLPYLPLVGQNASLALKEPITYPTFNPFYNSQPAFAAVRG